MINRTVVIAGKQYTITPKPIIESRAWREKLAAPLNGLFAVLNNADTLRLENPEDLKRLLDLFMASIANSPDLILQLVCDYAPEIGVDRERIETEGFDYEVMSAFKEVLTLVYPFGTLLNFIKRRG